MNERRVFLAAIISVVFFAGYMQYMTARYPQLKRQKAQAASPAGNQEASLQSGNALALSPVPDEAVQTLTSEHLKLEIGLQTGALRAATLQKYLDEEKQPGVRFASGYPIAQLTFGDKATWKKQSETAQSVAFQVEDEAGCTHAVSYELVPSKPVVQLRVRSAECAASAPGAHLIGSWSKSTSHSSVQNRLEWDVLTYKEPGVGKKYSKKTGILRKPYAVPRGTAQVTLTERYFCQSTRLTGELAQTRLFSNGESLPVTESLLPNREHSIAIYLGSRDYFELQQAGFEEAFHVNILGRIGLVLLAILSWIAGMTHNYGIAIMCFSFLITLVMSPFTLISFRSMKKMQVLQPQLKKIMDKHKDDQVKANQEVFALYREHRVSPLSGCLPILLQWPLLIALLQAITSYTALRGQAFLWIRDLSLPDRLAQLPFVLPILGNELNLLPALMAGAMFMQTRTSQSGAAVDNSNPTAAMMSGPMMPILFAVMLYHVPAGLVLYWLTNSILGTLLYRWAKR